MRDTLGRRSSNSWVAWIAALWVVAAVAVVGIVAVAMVDDSYSGAMHDDRGFGMSAVAGGGMMSSGGMMPAGEATFLVEMIAHHDEAIEAATELRRSDRAELRELGEAIVDSQGAQIVQMRAWLEQWHDDAGPAAYTPMMRDLRALSGDELDRTFLEDMVMHHWMAVMMSRHLLMGTDDLHSEVASLARDIVREQTTEIGQMRLWLEDWFDVRTGMGPGLSMMTW